VIGHAMHGDPHYEQAAARPEDSFSRSANSPVIYAIQFLGHRWRLPARGSGPSSFGRNWMLDSAKADNRGRPVTKQNMVVRSCEGFNAHRSQASSSVDRVANTIREALAFPSRLPLGCQCQSLYISGDCVQKGRRTDEGISIYTRREVPIASRVESPSYYKGLRIPGNFRNHCAISQRNHSSQSAAA